MSKKSEDTPEQSEDTPKTADFILKEADAVRAEIVYKMQLVHRTTLAMLIAPNVVLPAIAKLAEQTLPKSPNASPVFGTTSVGLVMTVISACLPLLLLWADLFCHSQVNGILRAGSWLRSLEQNLDLSETRNGWSGWENWISRNRRRLWDDYLFTWLRVVLVFLYYIAAAGMASFLIGGMLQYLGVPGLLRVADDHAPTVSYGTPALLFTVLYIAARRFEFRKTYNEKSTADTNEPLEQVEFAIISSAPNAYRRPTGALKFPYVASSIGVPTMVEPDPLRMLGESSRVLGSYQELYDWDGIFCGGALLHEAAPLNGVLEGVVRNFLSAQSADGFVPRSLTHDGRQLDPGELCKPLLAQGALAVSRAYGDQGWLDEKTFNALVAFVEYWLRERRGPSGMFKWRSALESGGDNNACLVNFPPLSIEAVDATCFLARECIALALLASERGNDPIALRMRRCALDAQQALLTKSWDEKAAFFWNRHVDTGLPVKLMSWTGLMPLWGGLVPKPLVVRVVRQHLRPGGPFLTEYGITTLARKEPAFNNGRRAYIWDHTAQARKEVSNWQGPTWVLPNALLADALAATGYGSLAKLICRGTLVLLARDIRDTGFMHECYDAGSGAPLWAPGFLSWNALGIGMSRWLQGRSPTILPAGLSVLSVRLP